MYDTGLQLRVCAKAWEPDARLIGNIRAGDLVEMAMDYARLRLQAGISDSEHAPPKDAWQPINAGTGEQHNPYASYSDPDGKRLAFAWLKGHRDAQKRRAAISTDLDADATGPN